MRKLLIILIFFLILNFNRNVYALTIEQQNNITTYAKEIIEKGNKRIAKDGTPLLQYGSGETRLPAFENKLYNGHFVFNCDSYISYVLYRTYGIPVIHSWGTPWTVSNYADGGRNGKIMQNITEGTYNNIKKNLIKGDLVLCFGFDNNTGNYTIDHIVMYIGDDLIAHARSKGLTIQTFESYQKSYSKYRIIRVKNDAPTKQLDMSIIWPDTGKKEILGYDELPKINISLNNKKVTNYNMPINFTDDKGLTAYSISTTNSANSWKLINKQLNYSTVYEIKENGTYYIFVKDTKNQISTKTVTIDFIDNNTPVINDIVYQYNEDKTFNITINATDESNLSYSIDEINYNTSNFFTNLSYNTYVIKIKDEAGNITNKLIDLTEQKMNMATYEIDNNFTKEKQIKIRFNPNVQVTSYNVTNTLNEPLEWINVNEMNITYNIQQSGVYYLWTRNNDGVAIYQEIVLDKVDNKPPTIKKIYVAENKNNLFDIIIDALDEGCGIQGYSLDNINYQESSTFKNLSSKKYTIYIKDKCNNIINYEYDLSNRKINGNNTYIYVILILILLVTSIIIYILIKRKKNNY